MQSYGWSYPGQKEILFSTLFDKASVSSLQYIELLAYGIPIEFQTMLVMKSPQLRRLIWPASESQKVLARFAEALDIYHPHGFIFHQLESFSIPTHGYFVLSDFKRVMESLPALTDLEMGGHDPISGHVFSYLMTLSHLRRLSVAGCHWITPNMILDILCSMSNLEVLEAGTLSDRAILDDPRPWICTGLRVLKISNLSMSKPMFSDEAVILDRLCQLVNLEELRLFNRSIEVNHPGCSKTNEVYPSLDKLKTLTRLRCFKVPVIQLWTETEIQWATEHWPRLEVLDVKMEYKAKELLSQLLIKKGMGQNASNS